MDTPWVPIHTCIESILGLFLSQSSLEQTSLLVYELLCLSGKPVEGGDACPQRPLIGRNSSVVVCLSMCVGGGVDLNSIYCLGPTMQLFEVGLIILSCRGPTATSHIPIGVGESKCQSASMLMCVHVYIWWVRTAVAGCASPNIISGQTGPIATYWARFWVPQKSPNTQKPQGSDPCWSGFSCDTSRQA